ncbi:uroporphyrinogen decarboxylase family protein [Maledivibacter halophilus]|uniref:Uroporphyrinogen decarboxylase n=1 Tax=Maledivibacter halophilus TaxID=36842 RepID=A0A1T5IAH8_9FIRM|nr:uroporphyrinogen decarboxylase family protein [Maledivibacter halophilus]SKC36186.1 uroporphyrinogen decarboxylase [Maledivibacter halophilus]
MASLTSRERIIRALNHQETDIIPIDIGGIYNQTTLHKDAYTKLQRYLGYENEITISSILSQSAFPDEYIRKRFKADCYPLYVSLDRVEYKIEKNENGVISYKDEWGVRWECPQNGVCFNPVGHPLEGCTLDDIDKFPWPDPKDKRKWSGMGEKAKEIYENTDYALVVNGPLDGGIYVPCQWLMGYESFFIKMMTEPEIVEAMLEKIVKYHIGQWNVILDEVGKYSQVVVLSDDLGTQNSPLMRPSLYKEIIKPAQAKVVNFIKSKADVKIVYHCDGAVHKFIPDFIELGMDAWNPVQISADGMDDTAYFNKKFGDKLAFWGAGCDSETILSTKAPEEIRQEVKRRINDLAPGGGLVLGSINNIEKNVPVENIVTFYDALYEFGSRFYG